MKLADRLDGIREGMYWIKELIASKLPPPSTKAQAAKRRLVTAVPLRVIRDSLLYP